MAASAGARIPPSRRALSLSINTVGTHIRNIYAKLQATDRSTAVRRARELQLLGNGTAR